MPASELRSELKDAIDRYLADLRLKNASPHTLRAYGIDLADFADYFSPPGESHETGPPAPGSITALELREWLGSLYERGLDPISTRRKLAVVRSLFRFLAREGTIETNVARLVRTPKAPKRIPIVPSAEQTNGLIDSVATADLERTHPERDLLLFELLYGCGLRISELVGLNLDDFDRSEQWIRVRGKGRKERQVPYGSKAASALDRYLPSRAAAKPEETGSAVEPPGRSIERSHRTRDRKVLCPHAGRRRLASSTQFPPRLRDSSSGRRRGSASHSGTAGARAFIHHAEIHPGLADGFNGRVRPLPSEGAWLALNGRSR